MSKNLKIEISKYINLTSEQEIRLNEVQKEINFLYDKIIQQMNIIGCGKIFISNKSEIKLPDSEPHTNNKIFICEGPRLEVLTETSTEFKDTVNKILEDSFGARNL